MNVSTFRASALNEPDPAQRPDIRPLTATGGAASTERGAVKLLLFAPNPHSNQTLTGELRNDRAVECRHGVARTRHRQRAGDGQNSKQITVRVFVVLLPELSVAR